jgi:hypothetical protein
MKLLVRRTPVDTWLFVPGVRLSALVRGAVILLATALAPLSLPQLQGVTAEVFTGFPEHSLAILALLAFAFAYWMLTEHARSAYVTETRRLLPCIITLALLAITVGFAFFIVSDDLPLDPASASSSDSTSKFLQSLLMIEVSIMACLLVTPLWVPEEGKLTAISTPMTALNRLLEPSARAKIVSIEEAHTYEERVVLLSRALQEGAAALRVSNPDLEYAPEFDKLIKSMKELRTALDNVAAQDFEGKTSNAFQTWTTAANTTHELMKNG